MKRAITLLTASSWIFLPMNPSSASAEDLACPRISEAVERQVVQAVQAKYRLPADVTLRIQAQTAVDGTCQRKLDLTSGEAPSAYNTSVYISPDNRFLTFGLIDLQGTPPMDDQNRAKTIAGELAKGRFPWAGPKDANVVVTVFSDFECPYCRRFMQELRTQMRSGDWAGVKVAFRNLPLAIHPWAEEAARAAMCAQLQSGAAFWRLHDTIYQHQDEIKLENAKQLLMLYGEHVEGLDMHSFRDCVNDELTLGLVQRDTKLALFLNVRGTPTAFVNGRRIEPPGSIEAVKEAVAASKAGQTAN